MLFVWGSSAEKKKLREGEFFCPTCEQVRNFTLTQDVEESHVYGIPVGEKAKSDEYVVCKSCSTAYVPDVFKLDETGQENENSQFLPLKQHEGYKELYETCVDYETKLGLATQFGCLLWFTLPAALGIALHRWVLSDIPGRTIISIVVGIGAFLWGTKLFEKHSNKAEQKKYEKAIKRPLSEELQRNNLSPDRFQALLTNDHTLPTLAKVFNLDQP